MFKNLDDLREAHKLLSAICADRFKGLVGETTIVLPKFEIESNMTLSVISDAYVGTIPLLRSFIAKNLIEGQMGACGDETDVAVITGADLKELKALYDNLPHKKEIKSAYSLCKSTIFKQLARMDKKVNLEIENNGENKNSQRHPS